MDNISIHINNLNIQLSNSVKDINIENFSDQKLGFLFEIYSCIKLSQRYNSIFFPSSQILGYISDEDLERLCYTTNRIDLGIDIYNIEHNIIAQCKYYKKSTLNYSKICTFLANQYVIDDNKNEIKRNLILASNEDIQIHKYLDKFHMEKMEHIRYNSNDFISYLNDMKSFTYENTFTTKTILRDYQKQSIELIKNTTKNSIINLPTGTGKTIVCIKYMIDILKVDKNLKFLILVPRIILCEQWKNQILRFSKSSKISIINTNNCIENYDISSNITICVYNSYPKIYTLQFNKIFIDEAHNIFTSKIYKYTDEYQEYEQYQEENNINQDNEDNTLLDDTNNEEENEEIINNSDDEDNKYKNIIREKFMSSNNFILLSATIDKINNCDYFSYNIRDAIENKYLNDYTINFSYFNHTDIEENNIDTIVNYIIDKNIINSFIFVDTIKSANILSMELNKRVGCDKFSKVISCETSERNRRIIFNNFNNSVTKIIVNVNILSEGYDTDKVSNIIFLNSRKNNNFIIQSIGRSLRIYEGKPISNIYFFCSEENEKDYFNNIFSIKEVDRKYKNIREKRTPYIKFERVNNSEYNHEDIELMYEIKYNTINEIIDNLESKNYSFIDRLKKLEEYILLNNKRPIQASKDKEVKRLAMFLGNSIKYYKLCKNNVDKGYNNPWIRYSDRVEIFENFLSKSYISSNIKLNIEIKTNNRKKEENWFVDTLEKVKIFIITNNRRPCKNSGNESEKYLGAFLGNSLTSYTNLIDGDNSKWKELPERVPIFVEFLNNDIIKKYVIPVLKEDPDREFNEMLKRVELFITKYGKPPSKVVNKYEEDEKRLGEFLVKSKIEYMKCKNENFGTTNKWRNKLYRVEVFEKFLSNEKINGKVIFKKKDE